MKRVLIPAVIVMLALSLAACSGSTSPAAPAALGNTASSTAPAASASGNAAPSAADLTRTNDQAAVTVEVTPLNPNDKTAATLDFQIALNTHSVDLSFDLTAIAALRGDLGEEVKPTKWDGPTSGGHHVSGTLTFPQMKDRGKSLTLVLRGIAGVPERTFVWNVDGSK